MGSRQFLVLAAILVACGHAFAAQGFRSDSVVLYQPDEAFRARGIDAKALATYMKQLEKVCTVFFTAETTQEQLDIVVGLKPGRKVRVWFVSSRRSVQEKPLVTLRKQLEAVPAYPVHGGPFAFALRCTIAGASPPKDKEPYEPPMPKEWRAAIEGKPVLVPDGIFEKIWRN